MTDWGRKMFVTPGIVVDGKLVTNDLVDINLGMRILLGHSYYDDWAGSGQEVFVDARPAGQPGRHPAPVEPAHHPQAGEAGLARQAYSWTMSPRWFDGTDHLALDTGGGPIARLWSTALSGLVDTGYVKATGHSVVINLPRTVLKPEAAFEWKIPQWSNALERNRARTYFQAYMAALALHFVDKALAEIRAGHTETWTPFEVPDEAVSVGFTEAVRGVLSPPHGDPGGQDRELPPVPADAVERQRARHLRHARAPTRTRCRTRRSSRRTRPTTSRASTSCGPCAASTRACRAGSTCTPAKAARSGSSTRRAWRSGPTDGPAAMNRRELQDRSQEVEEVLDEFAGAGDDAALERAERLVRSLMGLYAAGLGRVLEIAEERDPALVRALADDDAVGSLLRPARPPPRRRRHPHPGGAGPGSSLPRVARRRDRVPRCRPGRRRASDPAGQLPRLPVLVGNRHDRGRGRRHGGGAGGHGGGCRGRRRRRPVVTAVADRAAARTGARDTGGRGRPGRVGAARRHSRPRGRPSASGSAASGCSWSTSGAPGYAYRDICPRCSGSFVRGRLDGDVARVSVLPGRFDVRLAGRGLDTRTGHLSPCRCSPTARAGRSRCPGA